MAKKIVFNIEVDSNLEGVDKQINDITSSTDDLKKQLKELTLAAQEATDPEDFRKLAQAAGEIKDRIQDTNRAINNFASDTQRLDVVVGSVRGIAGAFAAVQGTMALLGAENENLQKTLVKVQGSLAILNGVQEVTKTLNKDSAVGAALYAAKNKILTASIGTSTGALKAFRIALVATGLGAIVVALGLLVANFDKVKEAVLNLVPELRIVGELFQQFTDFVGITSDVDREVDKLRRTTDRKIQTDKNELEVLKAKGATQEEIFEREKAILDEGIKSYEETIRLKGKLNEKELEEYEKLIQQKKVLDAGYEKFRQDEADKIAAEQQRAADDALNVERRNQQRRIDLLNDGLFKSLALLRLNYQKERAEAIKNGENLLLVDKNYQKNRNQIINDAKNEIKKLVDGLNDELLNIEGKSYSIRLAEIRRFERERRNIIKDRIDEIQELLEKQGSTEIETNEEVLSLKKAQRDSELLEQKKIENLRKDISSEALKSQIKLREESGLEALDLQEKLLKLEFEKIKKDNLLKIKNQIDLNKKEDEIIKEDIRKKAALEDVRLFRKGQIDIDEVDRREELRKDTFLKEQMQTQKQNGFLLASYEEYYDNLEKLQLENLRINEKIRKEKNILDELEKNSLDERLKVETDFQMKRNDILEREAGNNFLIDFKKNLELRQLDRELKRDLIENEKKFVKEKIKILAEDPTRNIDELKKLNKRLLELDNELLQDRVDLQTEKNDILNNAIREYIAGVENVLSGFNDFIGGLAAESNDLLRKVQDDNTKLLNEGKITQEEFNKLQEKATKENEKRQEKLFYQQQNIEVVRTIISGLSSAQQAFQSQFSPVPDASSPARGAIAAGLALAAATARVLAIKKQKYQRSGSVTAATPNLGSGRVVGGVGGSTIMEPTLRNDLGQSLRVFVLEGDITETQRRVRIVRGGANTNF